MELDQLVSEWKKEGAYTDVEAVHLNCPSDQQIQKTCPHGCELQIAKVKHSIGPWHPMEESGDRYRQTRICRKHGYARIYVTTGLEAVHANYQLVTQ